MFSHYCWKQYCDSIITFRTEVFRIRMILHRNAIAFGPENVAVEIKLSRTESFLTMRLRFIMEISALPHYF